MPHYTRTRLKIGGDRCYGGMNLHMKFLVHAIMNIYEGGEERSTTLSVCRHNGGWFGAAFQPLFGNWWNYECRIVWSDFNPPCRSIWKAFDWQELHFSASQWPQTHCQCSKNKLDRKTYNGSLSVMNLYPQILDYKIIEVVRDHLDGAQSNKQQTLPPPPIFCTAIYKDSKFGEVW